MKSKPTGFLTIEGPYSKSMVPSTLGNMSGSVVSESAAYLGLQSSQEFINSMLRSK